MGSWPSVVFREAIGDGQKREVRVAGEMGGDGGVAEEEGEDEVCDEEGDVEGGGGEAEELG